MAVSGPSIPVSADGLGVDLGMSSAAGGHNCPRQHGAVVDTILYRRS